MVRNGKNQEVNAATAAERPLPENWRTVRFDEIAESVADRVDPAKAVAEGVEYYVGLEHLDSESLKIRRWGTPADVIGQKLRFRAGDIVFGRRRCYQRKLAVAEFDGICSAHAMVLRANEDAVEKDFLPFFLQSDMFMERALAISVGSLSPTINWRTLRVQEFSLPRRDEQRRIADILWAAEDALRASEGTKGSLLCLIGAISAEFMRGDFPRVSLGELLTTVQYGSSKCVEKRSDRTVPMLRIPNVLAGRIDLTDLGWVHLRAADRKKYALEAGDVLIVRTNGNPDYVGRTAVVENCPSGSAYASYLIRLRCDVSRLLPKYIHVALSSPVLRRTLRHEIRSSAGNYNLNTRGIKRQEIPLPPMHVQRRFVEEIEGLDKRLSLVEQHINSQKMVKKELVTGFFGSGKV